MKKDALLSPCRLYRYWLLRRWDETKPLFMYIGLNPSTADETTDDQTIRRLIAFTVSNGGGGFYVVNLFAFRATNPDMLTMVNDPVGPMNDHYINEISTDAARVIFCWGVLGGLFGRDKEVSRRFYNAQCFGKTKCLQPKHPVRLHGNTSLVPFDIGSMFVCGDCDRDGGKEVPAKSMNLHRHDNDAMRRYYCATCGAKHYPEAYAKLSTTKV